jgi:hypothetical protein
LVLVAVVEIPLCRDSFELLAVAVAAAATQ